MGAAAMARADRRAAVGVVVRSALTLLEGVSRAAGSGFGPGPSSIHGACIFMHRGRARGAGSRGGGGGLERAIVDRASGPHVVRRAKRGHIV